MKPHSHPVSPKRKTLNPNVLTRFECKELRPSKPSVSPKVKTVTNKEKDELVAKQALSGNNSSLFSLTLSGSAKKL